MESATAVARRQRPRYLDGWSLHGLVDRGSCRAGPAADAAGLLRPGGAAFRLHLGVADDPDPSGAAGATPGIFTWSLRWTPFAIGRQISPLFSDYLDPPDGVNLMWNTWVPLPGLLVSPLTLASGPC